MNKVELTPAKLAELKRWIKLAQESNWVSKLGLCGRAWIQDEYDLVNLRDCFPDKFENDDQGKAYSDAICVLEFIAAADPATVLALLDELTDVRMALLELAWEFYGRDQTREEIESCCAVMVENERASRKESEAGQ